MRWRSNSPIGGRQKILWPPLAQAGDFRYAYKTMRCRDLDMRARDPNRKVLDGNCAVSNQARTEPTRFSGWPDSANGQGARVRYNPTAGMVRLPAVKNSLDLRMPRAMFA